MANATSLVRLLQMNSPKPILENVLYTYSVSTFLKGYPKSSSKDRAHPQFRPPQTQYFWRNYGLFKKYQTAAVSHAQQFVFTRKGFLLPSKKKALKLAYLS